jgi:hypothetical protein
MVAKQLSQARRQFRSDLADGPGYQNPFHTASCGLRSCGSLSVGKVALGQLAPNLGGDALALPIISYQDKELSHIHCS